MNGFHGPRHVIEDDEPLHASSVCHEVHQVRGSRNRFFRVIAGDTAAHDNTGIEIEVVKGRFKRIAAYIVEEDIPLIGAGSGNLLIQVALLVVDRCIQPCYFGEPPTFVWTACDADHSTPFNLGYLARNRAGGAGSA